MASGQEESLSLRLWCIAKIQAGGTQILLSQISEDLTYDAWQHCPHLWIQNRSLENLYLWLLWLVCQAWPCNAVAFGHHVSYDGMLAPWEDVECTVLAGADGAIKAVGMFETDSMFLVVDCAGPVFDRCLFFPCERARHRPEGITDFAVSTLILDWILVVGAVVGISLCVA